MSEKQSDKRHALIERIEKKGLQVFGANAVSYEDEKIILEALKAFTPSHVARNWLVIDGEKEADALADLVIMDVSEIPDRFSPEDAPEQMLVTGPELRSIIKQRLTELCASTPSTTPRRTVEAARALLQEWIDYHDDQESMADAMGVDASADYHKEQREGLQALLAPKVETTASATPRIVTDEMVNRFLSWKLPKAFHPDAGISFKRYFNVEYNAKHGKPPQCHEPMGTNLLTATQARAMLEHVIGTTDGGKQT